MEKVKEIKGSRRKMTFKFSLCWLVFLVVFCFSCRKETENIRLEKGMVISESVTVAKDTFRINTDNSIDSEAILIQGENITIDFQGAVLQGSNDKTYPDELYGVGVKVQGKNIEIKNLIVHGFRLGLEARNVDGLKINNSEFSYNHRCKNTNYIDQYDCNPLGTNPRKIIHYSAGIKIIDCKNIELTRNKITQNSFGIVINTLNNSSIYNNTISYNSETGIMASGMDNVKIMHNFLDWNKKFGFNCPISSKNNLIAYNSITHSKYNRFYKNTSFANNLFPKQKANGNVDSLRKLYPPLENGQKTDSLLTLYKGEEYILNDEWGLYNFKYPAIWLREINDNKYTFAIFGPEGNWKIVNGNGFVQTSRQSGSTPATIVASKAENNEEPLSLDLEFIGVEFTDRFGKRNPRGKTYKFEFKSLEE